MEAILLACPDLQHCELNDNKNDNNNYYYYYHHKYYTHSRSVKIT